MRPYDITPLSEEALLQAQSYIDRIAKPLGSMGQLETLAARLAAIQDTLRPELSPREHFVFAADHGIVDEEISKSPKEVTRQVVYSMLRGGAGICFLCRQHDFRLHIVDVGVDHDFGDEAQLIHRKLRHGTRSYLREAAMTEDEALRALQIGEVSVDEALERGCRLLSFGEMGITNTSSSALWMYYLTDLPLEACIGRGSGLDDEGMERKLRILRLAVANYTGDASPWSVLCYFGGYELVTTVGAMLRAAERRTPFLVDGFIMSACLLMARSFAPAVTDYAFYGHLGDEAGHARLLRYLEAQPILKLGLRLGEGTGAVCAFPILDSAARMLREMASFTTSGVTDYIGITES